MNDIVGDVPLVAFGLDHADDAMRRLDEVRRKRAGRDVKLLRPGGRRQYAQLIARVLKLAAYPARIIKTSPLPTGWLPRVPNNKAKGLLFPEEEAKTLGYTAHSIHWRMFFGFLARAGFRADEGAGLAMKDVDVERGIITLDENKTDDPRTPTFGPELMTALKAWKETWRLGAGPDDLFFTRPDGARIPIDGLAELYRETFVRDAGVDRPEERDGEPLSTGRPNRGRSAGRFADPPAPGDPRTCCRVHGSKCGRRSEKGDPRTFTKC